MNSPPFCHIGVIIVSGEDENNAKDSLVALKNWIIKQSGKENTLECSDVLQAPVFIIRNRYRWRLIIKTKSINNLVQLMNEVLDIFPKVKSGRTDISVDIDPASMV